MTDLLDQPQAPPAKPRRRTGRRRVVLRVVSLVLLVAVVYFLVTCFQVYRASRHDGARPADAIVVLGAAQYYGKPSPVLQARLDHALDLYHEGIADTIVVTGGRQASDKFTEATSGYNYLRDRGVPDSAIRKEVQGTSTWESLKASARFLEDEGKTKVVLVSDDYHAYRAGQIANSVGLDAAVSPSDSGLMQAQELREIFRESVAVSIGRLIGYDRLQRLEDSLND